MKKKLSLRIAGKSKKIAIYKRAISMVGGRLNHVQNRIESKKVLLIYKIACYCNKRHQVPIKKIMYLLI
jgi:hypothetical protein